MAKYAEKTGVSVSKSKADIEDLVQKYGADQFISGYKDDVAVIGFTLNNRQIRFKIDLPDKNDREFLYTPERRNLRSKEAALSAWEQACRQKWRALFLVIKAKLEAVESGISCFEDEFLNKTVLPNGQTVEEYMRPQIEEVYRGGKMPELLPMLND